MKDNFIVKFLKNAEISKLKNNNCISYMRVYASFIMIYNHLLINMQRDLGYKLHFPLITNLHMYLNTMMFMMTGYTYMKLKKHITVRMSFSIVLKNVLILLIFGSAFAFIELFYRSGYVFDVNMIVKSINASIQGTTWDHMWYFYFLTIVYLLMPYLSRIFKSDDVILLPMFTLILLLSCYFGDVLLHMGNVLVSMNPINNVIFAVASGAFLYRYKIFEKVNLWLMIGIWVIAFLVLLHFHNDKYYFCRLLLGFLLFAIFEKGFTKKSKVFNYLSKHTLTIYLMHCVFLHLLTKVLKINPFDFGGFFGIYLFIFIIYVASLLSSILMEKIVILKQILY